MSKLEMLVDAVLPAWPPLDPEEASAVRKHCTAFVRTQIAGAPAHVRIGILGLLTIFSIFAVFRLGPVPLSFASRERRAAALAAFSNLGPPILAAVDRVVRSMALLAFFEHPSVLKAMGEQPVCYPAAEAAAQ